MPDESNMIDDLLREGFPGGADLSSEQIASLKSALRMMIAEEMGEPEEMDEEDDGEMDAPDAALVFGSGPA